MATKGKIECENKRSDLILKYRRTRERLKNEINCVRKEIKPVSPVSPGSEKEALPERSTEEIKEITQKLISLQSKLHKLPRNSSPTRSKNRCWATGRSRGFYRDFGLSRHVLREMGFKGLIPGLKKSSW